MPLEVYIYDQKGANNESRRLKYCTYNVKFANWLYIMNFKRVYLQKLRVFN